MIKGKPFLKSCSFAYDGISNVGNPSLIAETDFHNHFREFF